MDLSKMTIADLKSLAKEKAVTVPSSIKKQDLIDLLQSSETTAKVEAAKKPTAKKAADEKEPVKEAPAKRTSDEKTPVKEAPAKKTSTEKEQAKEAPAKKTSDEKEQVKEAPAKKTSTEKAQVKKAPIGKTSAKNEPAKEAPAGKTSAENESAKEAPKKVQAKKAPAEVTSDTKEQPESIPARKASAAAEIKSVAESMTQPVDTPSEQSSLREQSGSFKRPSFDSRSTARTQSFSPETRNQQRTQSFSPDARNSQRAQQNRRPTQPGQPVAPDARRPMQPGQPVAPDTRRPMQPAQPVAPDARRPMQSGQPVASEERRPAATAQPLPYDVRPGQYIPSPDIPSPVSRESVGEKAYEDNIKSDPSLPADIENLDSGESKTGILEVLPEGYGFIRCDNFLPGDGDVYVSPAQIRKFNLKTGDFIEGNTKIRAATEKFCALLYIKSINGFHPSEAIKRPKFEDLTPVFPHERLHLETPGCTSAVRIVDLLSPIGKGQRGMIVSQPKAGKTTLLKQIAGAITRNHPDMHLIILLIDERPEEVTDMKESISGPNVEVIHSTFDELPERHKRVSEMVIERARRLVEHKKDVIILLDSITRLARAYNLTCTASGRTLSGGLDPAALHMPKKFFGAARCMREGGSLTILATALVETGSRMDDVVFEEFKGTGNMELVLDRSLSEKRIFPAIDLPKSGTRRDDLLLTPDELEANLHIRRAFSSIKGDEAVERIITLFARTKSNKEFMEVLKKTKLISGPVERPGIAPSNDRF